MPLWWSRTGQTELQNLALIPSQHRHAPALQRRLCRIPPSQFEPVRNALALRQWLDQNEDHMDHPSPIAQARGRNPDLDRTDLRASVRKFTMDVIDAEVNYRTRHTDPAASRNQVINEILEEWATKQWHRATMTVALAPSNPLIAESQEVDHG